MIIDSILKY